MISHPKARISREMFRDQPNGPPHRLILAISGKTSLIRRSWAQLDQGPGVCPAAIALFIASRWLIRCMRTGCCAPWSRIGV